MIFLLLPGVQQNPLRPFGGANSCSVRFADAQRTLPVNSWIPAPRLLHAGTSFAGMTV
jgi:hypothetical protein